MTTKAELQAENEVLRSVVNGGTNISDCVFHGSATDAQCEAVKEIAIALQYAAKALQGHPAIVVNPDAKGAFAAPRLDCINQD
jgi:hypothetical protein